MIKKIVFIILIMTILSIGHYTYFSRSPNDISQNESISTPAILKTYRNEEWGFEFQYPEKWVLRREHESLTYYSKFFLTMAVPTKERKFDETFLVNIVLPEFIRGLDSLEKTTSEIIVSGVYGIKYEYVFNDFPETTVILPFGEFTMILTTGEGSKQYLDEFNQILTSFNFLK